MKAEEYDEREADKKISLPVSLVIDFIPYMILDQGFIKEEDALNKWTNNVI